MGSAIDPAEAYAPLVIDSNAVLALAAALQSLQAIPRRRSQVGQDRGSVEHLQLSKCATFERLETSDGCAIKQLLCVAATKRLDHMSEYYALRQA